MRFIHSELEQNQVETKLVLIPSAREINHLSPLPQPKYLENLIGASNMHKTTLLQNPASFKINGINFGVANADIVKDMCMGLITKNVQEPKIEVGVKNVLQQRTFFPMYPAS